MLQVKWAGQQKIVERSKRGYIPRLLPLSPRGLQQDLLLTALKTATGGGDSKITMAMGAFKMAGYSGNAAVKALSCLKSGKALFECGIHLPGKMIKHLVRNTHSCDNIVHRLYCYCCFSTFGKCINEACQCWPVYVTIATDL